MNNKLIENLLTILNQLKFYHWGANSYAQHKALGDAYDQLNIIIDDFVEILLGKDGKELSPISINIRTESELNINDALNEISEYLSNDILSFLNENDTDLLNLRDEILSIINKTKYLLKLT